MSVDCKHHNWCKAQKARFPGPVPVLPIRRLRGDKLGAEGCLSSPLGTRKVAKLRLGAPLGTAHWEPVATSSSCRTVRVGSASTGQTLLCFLLAAPEAMIRHPRPSEDASPRPEAHLRVELLLRAGVTVLAGVSVLTLAGVSPLIPVFYIWTWR